MSGKQNAVNQGIQAQTVRAKALAVGSNASVTYTENSAAPEELRTTLAALEAAIDRLGLTPVAHEAVKEDLGKLAEAAGEQPNPERARSLLESIAGKLKMVGVIAADVAAFAEPARKIAGLLGFAWPAS
jgi:hypothetical protein